MELKKKYPGLAALAEDEDVEDVILRSNKAMEDSRSVVLKNMRIKQGEFIGKYLEDNTVDNSILTGKVLDKEGNQVWGSGIMFQEIQALNLKLAGQLAYIKTLESKLNDFKLDNEKLSEKNLRLKAQHREEIFYITQMYEEKITRITQPNISGLETRIQELEKKLKQKAPKSQPKLMQDESKKVNLKRLRNYKKSSKVFSTTHANSKKKSRSFSESRILPAKS